MGGQDNYDKSAPCPLGTAKLLVKQGGELVAVPHAVKKTGYKAPNAYGAKDIFNGETTNGFYQKKVRKVGEGSTTKTKKLMPYHPLASRNRPKESMENYTGTRFGLKVTRDSVETYRGSSQVVLADGHPDSSKPWKTTNQAYSENKEAVNKTGLANQGIFSDAAKITHTRQRR